MVLSPFNTVFMNICLCFKKSEFIWGAVSTTLIGGFSLIFFLFVQKDFSLKLGSFFSLLEATSFNFYLEPKIKLKNQPLNGPLQSWVLRKLMAPSSRSPAPASQSLGPGVSLITLDLEHTLWYLTFWPLMVTSSRLFLPPWHLTATLSYIPTIALPYKTAWCWHETASLWLRVGLTLCGQLFL